MTVSTAGIVPRIRDFGKEAVRPRLAISLNGSNDALRSELMPLNRKWNLAELMQAAREFPLRTRERMTVEYVLLAGVNDAPEQAREAGGVGAGHAGEDQFDCAESGDGVALPDAGRGAGGGVPANIGRGRNSGVCAAAEGARHFCRVRTAEAGRPQGFRSFKVSGVTLSDTGLSFETLTL